MDPNDQNQNPIGPTNVPQGPGPDDGQGVPAADEPQVPSQPPSSPTDQGEGELPPPLPVGIPSDVPADGNDSSQVV